MKKLARIALFLGLMAWATVANAFYSDIFASGNIAAGFTFTDPNSTGPEFYITIQSLTPAVDVYVEVLYDASPATTAYSIIPPM